MNPSWYGYNGISMFSSMAYEHSSNLYYNTGIAGNFINSYTYRPQTPVFHSMFNLKYLVDNDPEVHLDPKYFSQIGELSGLTVYKNNYYLPIAYGVKDDIVNWDHATGNPFQVQNDFLRRAAGISEAVFTNVTLTDVSYNNVDPFTDVLNSGSYSFNKTSAGAEGSFTVSFAPEETGRYYVYCRTGNADTIYLSADDGYSAQTPVSTDNQYVFDLGTRTKDVTVRIEVPLNDDSGSVELFVVRQNDDVFEKAYRVLSKNVMEVTRFEDTLVEGTVTLDQGQRLYTSINYDEGWTIEIDGKPINYELAMSSGEVEKIGDALIGLHMGPGTHTLSFRYHAKGLRTGLLLSLLGVLLLLALTLLPGRVGRRRKSSSGHIENDNENVE
ncbi:MAG: YfhO family protein, partial [Clostridia bacterium]|nr:YfhO family protein [Clostridia bacterium]